MVTAPPTFREPEGVPSSVPAVTAFAFARLINPDDRTEPLELTHEGHLVVTIRGDMMARVDGLLFGSQNLIPKPVQQRMHGRAVTDVFQRLVSLEGEGHLVLAREGERFVLLELRRDLCFFAERYLWALESSLMWDAGIMPGSRRERPMSLLRVAGAGAIALRVPGDLVAVKIVPSKPYKIRRDRFVGWIGGVIPRLQDSAFLHCEGEGAVLVTLPRGRDAVA